MFLLGRRLGLACVAAVVALLVGGCSGGGSKPVSLPSISPTDAPSPSATSTQTQLEAVSAVVRQYYSLLNGDTTTANATALAALMTPSCPCREVVTATKQAVARHQHFFGTNSVVSIVPNMDGPAAADVLVTYDYTRSGIKNASGRVVSSGPGRRGTTQDFRLVKQNGAWLIAKILRVSSGKPA